MSLASPICPKSTNLGDWVAKMSTWQTTCESGRHQTPRSKWAKFWWTSQSTRICASRGFPKPSSTLSSLWLTQPTCSVDSRNKSSARTWSSKASLTVLCCKICTEYFPRCYKKARKWKRLKKTKNSVNITAHKQSCSILPISTMSYLRRQISDSTKWKISHIPMR